jgi:hypothetical protein
MIDLSILLIWPADIEVLKSIINVYCAMFNLDNLKDLIFKFLKVDFLLESLSNYIETRVSLIKKEIKDEVARQLSKVIVFIFVMTLILFAIGFMSTGLAFLIGELVENMYAGFMIVGGFYLFISILIWFSRRSVGKKVENTLKNRLD